MKSLLASLRGGIPSNVASNAVSINPPLRRSRFGSMHLLVEGANAQVRQAFGNALVSGYYRQTGDSVAANMTLAIRAALAVAEDRVRFSGDNRLGFTVAVAADDSLHLFQLSPTLACFFRNNEVLKLPAAGIDPAFGRIDRGVEHYSTEFEPGDVLILLDSHAGGSLTRTELATLLRRRSPSASAQQLALLLARRGVLDCDVLVLQDPVMAPIPNSDDGPARISVPVWRRPPIAERGPGSEGEGDPLEAFLQDEERGAIIDARAGRRLNAQPTRGSGAAESISQSGTGSLQAAWSKIQRALLGEPDPIAIDGSYVEGIPRPAGSGEVGRAEPGAPGSGDRKHPEPRSRRFGDLGGDSISRSRPQSRRLGLGAAILVVAVALLLLVLALVGLRPPAAESEGGGPFVPLAATTAPPVQTAAAAQAFARAQEILADAIGQSDDGQSLVLALEAENQARLARELGTSAADVDSLLAQIEAEQDRRNHVYRVATSQVLGEFGTDIGYATGNQLEVLGGTYFVLDVTANRLIEISEPGKPQTTQLDGTPLSGRPISALVARPLGLQAISRDGVILSIEGDGGRANLVLIDRPAWGEMADADNFQNNLYRLQPNENQIYKYTPTTLGYELDPVPFLEQAVDIGGALDMAIDGDVYLLLADNQIQRYRVGQQVLFDVSDLDKPLTDPILIYTDQRLESLYVIDAAFARVVELDKRPGREGEFIRQFLYTGSDNFFADVRGLWVDEAAGIMVVLGADSLREFRLPALRAGGA